MYLCYLDESGTPDLSSNTPNFVYAGLAIPADTWRDKDQQIQSIKIRHHLQTAELHAGWMARPFVEQERIPNFTSLSHEERRKAVRDARVAELYKLDLAGASLNTRNNRKKNYKKTSGYTHLTHDERIAFLEDVATCIQQWSDARLFFCAIDKRAFAPNRCRMGGIYEESFHQLASRFQAFLKNKGNREGKQHIGLLITDNNDSVKEKLTSLARRFHRDGTFWNDIDNIVETPLFVDSMLTSMVQVADLASYAIRIYLDKRDKHFFDPIFSRVDYAGSVMVGGRHYTWDSPCNCAICEKAGR